jgi:predicted phage terminase large subunit-like protein
MNREKAARFLQKTVLENPYIPWEPTVQQAKFLLTPHRELLFGGAAGGGKTVAILMGALQFVHVPGYNALILRKTYPMLARADSPIPLSQEWLSGTDAAYNNSDHLWTFPSGATLQFGHCQYDQDKYNFQGSAYQYIAFDELTHFLKSQYTYLMTRMRKATTLAKLPLRMRASANPGGIGHDWVKTRFIPEVHTDEDTGEETPIQKDHPFIPSMLSDNPHLDQASYIESLQELDPHERDQLLHGDWGTIPPGDVIEEEWFEYIDHTELPKHMDTIRYIDLAGTELKGKAKRSNDPDWTATAKVGEHRGVFYVLDVRRCRKSPLQRDVWLRKQAKQDGSIPIWIEQDPGQAGVSQVSTFQRDTLKEWTVRGNPKTHGKMVYWSMLAAKMEASLVKWVRAPWNDVVEQELVALTRNDSHAHDDQADAISGAVRMLLQHGGGDASFAISEAELEALERQEAEEEGDDLEDMGFAFD